MGTISSLNAVPPRPPANGGRGRLFSPQDDGARIGAIMSVTNEELVEAIGLACAAGIAIMFSPTSDGGALGVHIFVGPDRDKLYATTPEQFSRILASVRDISEAKLAGDPAAGMKRLQHRSERK
jgi:hypothetical protein